MNHFYDPGLATFPFRNAWVTKTLVHQYGRNLMFILALVLITATLLSMLHPGYRVFRTRCLLVLGTIIVSTVTISMLKRLTGVNCAWDLEQYGGNQPPNNITFFLDGSFGNCWPAGHASGPFSLIAFYFGFRDSFPLFAKSSLIVACLLGGIYGLAQTARGAHYISHTLWTLLFIWSINLLTTRFFQISPTVSTPGVSLD